MFIQVEFTKYFQENPPGFEYRDYTLLNSALRLAPGVFSSSRAKKWLPRACFSRPGHWDAAPRRKIVVPGEIWSSRVKSNSG